MKREKEFDLLGFVRILDRKKIQYLLIGRWAVILHGAPLMTADYDFWIPAKFRETILNYLDKSGYEVPPVSAGKKPIVTVYSGTDKIDFLFFHKMTNREGQVLDFRDCYRRADLKQDHPHKITVRIPSLDDLIALKKFERSTPDKEAQDATDILYLESIKRGKHL
ncbi:MAG TPA: hypothetical protein VFG11_11395 [Acidobacteriota bacterium]|nr:hypothetical protein [Acidobacteriota bacterium]